jgi:ABC-type bacteriocin/lantibiotic exporter with double-glycine peptidase domain
VIRPEGTGEKVIWPIALFVVISLPFIKPILDPINLDSLRTSCPDKVCLQTTYSTCGPSSAASILLSLGQDASEQSLAREALTSKGGTELWYLARALKRRGFKTKYVVRSSSPQEFPAPAVAGVVLTGGTGQFIALVSRSGDQITVVDPLKGKFSLSNVELNSRYHFSGVFLFISSSF